MTDTELTAIEVRKASAPTALVDACHIVWHHKSAEHEGCEHNPHFWTIPINPKRDVDCRIGDALRDIDALVAEVRRLQALCGRPGPVSAVQGMEDR